MENEGIRGKGPERTTEGRAAKVPGTALERRTSQEGPIMGATGAGKSDGAAAEVNRILHAEGAPRPVRIGGLEKSGSSGQDPMFLIDEPHRIIGGEPGQAERIVAMFQTAREPASTTWAQDALGEAIQRVGGINPFGPGPEGPSQTARELIQRIAREHTGPGASGRPQTPESGRPAAPQRRRPQG